MATLECPECDVLMVPAPRPLMRIFGDVRAFECSMCNYMLFLKYPLKPLLHEQLQVVGLLDAVRPPVSAVSSAS
jgi:hypothetical protein